MMEDGRIIPPRDGEGDRAQRGGGVFSAQPAALAMARRERRSGNLPEVLVWRALRQRPGGFKFRRQHPIDRYSLDFACLQARLAIEIDGESHAMGERPGRDIRRDERPSALGFRTLRVPACDVLNNLDEVVRGIVAACRERAPLHQPSAGPPPRAGEV